MSTGAVQPFQLAGSVTIAALSTASMSAELPLLGGVPVLGDVIVVSNPNGAAAYVAIGSDATVGGINSVVVLGGQRRVLNYNIFARFDPFSEFAFIPSVSAILTAGSGPVVFEVGTGSVFG